MRNRCDREGHNGRLLENYQTLTEGREGAGAEKELNIEVTKSFSNHRKLQLIVCVCKTRKETSLDRDDTEGRSLRPKRLMLI